MIVSLVILGLLGLFLYGMSTTRLETGVMPQPNAIAPDFQLPTFDGKTVRLSDLRGQPVVINFWASWCVPCRDEQPTLVQLAGTYKSRGVTFLGINIQDTDRDAGIYAQQFGINYPLAYDRSGAVYINYGVVGMPETYLVDKQGRIAQKIVGPVDPNQIVASLEVLLK